MIIIFCLKHFSLRRIIKEFFGEYSLLKLIGANFLLPMISRNELYNTILYGTTPRTSSASGSSALKMHPQPLGQCFQTFWGISMTLLPLTMSPAPPLKHFDAPAPLNNKSCPTSTPQTLRYLTLSTNNK